MPVLFPVQCSILQALQRVFIPADIPRDGSGTKKLFVFWGRGGTRRGEDANNLCVYNLPAVDLFSLRFTLPSSVAE